MITTVKKEFCEKHPLFCCAEFQFKRILTVLLLIRAMARALYHQPHTAFAWVQSPASLSLICCARSGTETRFSPSSAVFLCQYSSRNCPYLLVLSLTLHGCNLSHHIVSLNDSHTHTCTPSVVSFYIVLWNICYYSTSSDDLCSKMVGKSVFRLVIVFVMLSKNIKINTYRTVILPIILYGCETWLLTLRVERRLRVFENRVLRGIFGCKRD